MTVNINDLGGDFNMVLNRFERFIECFLRICAEEFKKTLDRLDKWIYLSLEVNGLALTRD